jgi:hypothetical protein
MVEESGVSNFGGLQQLASLHDHLLQIGIDDANSCMLLQNLLLAASSCCIFLLHLLAASIKKTKREPRKLRESFAIQAPSLTIRGPRD